ncbi:MAG: hypothetical protein ABSF94_06930 [Steroidobacteraceae bacterium]
MKSSSGDAIYVTSVAESKGNRPSPLLAAYIPLNPISAPFMLQRSAIAARSVRQRTDISDAGTDAKLARLADKP